MKLITALVLSLCAVSQADDKPVVAATFTPSGHTTDAPAVVKQRVGDKSAILLDVREKPEWAAGHLKQATLRPLSAVKSGQLTADMKKKLIRNKPIYVHCASGGRVLLVSRILRAQGYDIRPLRQGYAELVKAGFPKAPGEKKKKKP